MDDPFDLQRFLRMQDGAYGRALAEIRAGKKRLHWMWFIFPQLRGLGQSEASQYFGIGSLAEARAYIDHSQLGPRLRESTEAVVLWSSRRTAEAMLGEIDAIKLLSSMTLFDLVEPNGLFQEALDAFYNGARDERTLALLNGQA